jgi:hypothetical protein
MTKLTALLVAALTLAAVMARHQEPEIRRYLKMRAM